MERFANSPDDKTKSMDELISEADKLKEANKQAIKDAKTARRRQLEAAREAGKKVKPSFSGNKNGNIDDDLYDEFKDVFEDDEVKSSRTLEELLEEEEIVKSSHYDGYEIDEEVDAANPYGCNQYGHEWKGKHGEGWKPSGRGGASDKKEETTEKKEKSIEEEAKEHFEATPEQRQVIMQRWKKEVHNAKEAYEKYKDYRKEGQEEYQKEKARLKSELDKAIERFKEKIIESSKMRGWPLRQGQRVANTFLAQIL